MNMNAYFTLKGFVGMHAQPLPLFWIFLLLAVIAWTFRRKRFAGWMIAPGALLIAFCSFPPLSRAIAVRLERQHPVIAADAPPPAAIVVLGSGVAHPGDPNLPALTRLGDTARARLLEGVRLARRYPEARLFTSGHGFTLESCADAMAEAAVELGVDPGRITRFTTAWDTADEARLTSGAAGRGARVAVVTSAVHMPRAMELFNRQGLDAVAAPCDFIAPVSDAVLREIDAIRWQPRAVTIAEHERIWHELLGLLYVKYFGGE